MAITKKVVLFVGGVGGAKLAYGLAQIVDPECLTIVVNTGDDFDHLGLRICPDLDTVMYTLSEIVDKNQGWGVADDSFTTLQTLRESFQQDTWFQVGDKDFATHILRSQWLRSGLSLTQVTQRLTQSLGIAPTILPMTDAEMPTKIDTLEHGELGFQSYFVQNRWQPTIHAIRYTQTNRAKLSPQIENALNEADIVVIGPSNPWLSIAPIFAVPGMRETLQRRNIPKVAITPIVNGRAIKGPAAKIMAELGYEVSVTTVLTEYDSLINGFVYDNRDAALHHPKVRTIGLDTIMKTNTDKVSLSQQVLDWVASW